MAPTPRIVLHAGMGKAGSTSIQEWLRTRGADLHARSGVTTLFAAADRDGAVSVARHTEGDTNSLSVIGWVLEHPDERARVLDPFFVQLGAAADRYGTVVVSSETFTRPIAYGDEDLLRRFDELAGAYDVRIAYYVRPQHLALESGWKHWRSNREKRPSELFARLDLELHHHATLECVRRVAPRVTFEMRPCRPDLLVGGDVVTDFAAVLLDLDVDDSMRGFRENSGVPLEVANALTALPDPHPWPATRDAVVLEAVKALWSGATAPPSPQVALGRQVLQQACHERYEPANRDLLATLGWQTDTWVGAVPGIEDASFARMDDLWRADANGPELELLQRALGALVDARRELDALRSRRVVRSALAASRFLHR
jgi:hypothetical protein